MANVSAKFIDPAGVYSGYTSEEMHGHVRGRNQTKQTRGVIQVVITSGTVNLEMRVAENAPWLVAKTYDVSTIEEFVIPPRMRVVADGDAEVWYAETV